ncbi:MAG: glycoside hydrolase family 13 protein [Lachnospiraceae bacterium]
MKSKFVLDKRALFSDETGDYRIPAEPDCGDEVILRFRTARDNVDSVYVIMNETELKMEKCDSTDNFDFFEARFVCQKEMVMYYFEITKGKERCYYNKLGCVNETNSFNQFRFTPGFHTPMWAKGAVFYQIFIDRFYNGNPRGDVEDNEYYYTGGPSVHVKDWNQNPNALDVRCFYGGDLQGVEKKLDYLQYLGVDVIYFNPLFVSPSNHKYDTQDYDYIDPHIAVIEDDCEGQLEEGDQDNSHAKKYICRVTSKKNLEASNAYFAELAEEIHSRGMRYVLDGVFNHCGSFNKWMDREGIYAGQEGFEPGAYHDMNSIYRDYFDFKNNLWPNNGSYAGWWNYSTLPKLNYEKSPELHDYVMNIGQKWVKEPYCADGWRLDVAADLGHSTQYNHEFWRDFRKSVKGANENSIILAEHYGDPTSWLDGDQWDTVMNYDAFMEPVTWFLTGMEKHSDEKNDDLYGNGDWFFRTMSINMSKFQQPSLDVAMNELSNHDHSRFLTRTNRTIGRLASKGAEAAGENVEKSVLRAAVVIQMTWPGAPTIYYGDEAGVVGWTDPDSRRTFPWNRMDWELVEFHREMIEIHKKYSCFLTGSIKALKAEQHFICYGRFDKQYQAIILVNNKQEERIDEIPVWEIEVPDGVKMTRIMETGKNYYNVGAIYREVVDGSVTVIMPPKSSAVYLYQASR